MNISTEIASLSRLVGEERAVEYVAKAGFDAWDFSMFSMCKYDWQTMTVSSNEHPLGTGDYLGFARRLKKIGLDNGIVCNQSHAPGPSYFPGVITYFKRAIECTAEAGGKICVIHPDNYKNAEENAEMYLELLPFAKDCGVKIATENMWNWSKEGPKPAACSDENTFLEQLKAVDDPNFIACVDVGHAELKGLNTSAEKMILTLGDYVQALHLHDVDFLADLHDSLFSQKVDFAPIVKALKTINYKGVFSLEVSKPYSQVKPENLFDTIEHDYKMVRKLADMFEGKIQY